MEYKGDNPFDNSASPQSSDPRIIEIMKKEEDLNQRERDLEQRQRNLNERAQSMPQDPRKPNWPICRPFIYHDINADMTTPELVRLVRIAYIAWMVASVSLVYNFVALLANLIGASQSGTAIGDMILSIVYCMILLPVWFLIYRLLYRSGRKRKPSLFVGFFCLYVLQLTAYAGMAVGFPGTGCGGFWIMLDSFKENKVVGIMLLVSSVLWCICFALGVFIFILARVQYSVSGGYTQARKEFGSAAATTAAQNPDLVIQGASFAASNA